MKKFKEQTKKEKEEEKKEFFEFVKNRQKGREEKGISYFGYSLAELNKEQLLIVVNDLARDIKIAEKNEEEAMEHFFAAIK